MNDTKDKSIELNLIDPNDHLPLLYWFIKRNAYDGESPREIMGPCSVALLRAASLYDPADGRARFATYAIKSMRGALSNYRDSQAKFRHLVPRNVGRDNAPYVHLFSELGFAFATGQSRVFAVDEPNKIELDEEIAKYNLELKYAIRFLSKQEKQVIEKRFGTCLRDPMTLKEVAEHMDLTRERVRQIEARALMKLRDIFDANHIHPWESA